MTIFFITVITFSVIFSSAYALKNIGRYRSVAEAILGKA
jgi:hypothetical protein